MKKIYLFYVFLLIASAIKAQDKVNHLPNGLNETSGLQLTKDNYLLSINDSGNPEELFVLDTLGQLIKKIQINNFKNDDWEALSLDEMGRLYIGNFGNNNNQRKDLSIGVFKANYIHQEEIEPEYTIQFSYPDQKNFPPEEGKWRFDCEAFFATSDYIYLFTKSRVEPFDGKSYLYRIPNKPSQQKTELIGVLNLCKNNMIDCWVTDATYHYESKTIAVLTTKKIYFYQIEKLPILKGSELKLSHIEKLGFIKQREGITFSQKQNKLFLTDEKHRFLGGGNLYEINIEKDD